jgi:hypothetical protein
VLNRRYFVGWGENVRRTAKEDVNKSAVISEHILVVHAKGLRDSCRLPEGQAFFFFSVGSSGSYAVGKLVGALSWSLFHLVAR